LKKVVLSAFLSVLLSSAIIQMIDPVTPEISMPTPAPPPFPPDYQSTSNVRFIIRSDLTFENRGVETWDFTDEDRAISLFMNNSWQTVFLLHHSHPLESVTEDNDGNSIAILDFQRQLQPGEIVSYSVSYNVFSKLRMIPDLNENESGELEDIPENLREEFCISQPPFLVEDKGIREAARAIAGNETRVLTIIKEFVKWIWENIQYPSQRHENPYYPNETLKRREGDCDDQAILFATFCRVYGIPSYIQLGCIYLPDFYANVTTWGDHISNELRQIGWHGWAMAYVPSWGWLPIDLTFVMGSSAVPLNAIYHGAVTLQETIQYMNISKVDYVASSRKYRDLLQQNGFYLYSMDEMTMTFLGDVNCDFIVNTSDLYIIAKAFGSKLGDPDWNQIADTAEPCGEINIIDLFIAAREFGKTL
jgi:transglutaminase-like putative cysteine protease